MNVLARWLLHWRGLPLIAVTLAITIPAVFVARGTSSDDGSASFAELVLLGLLGVLVLLAVAVLATKLAGIDPDAAIIAQGLTAASDQRRLLSRWLHRSRWARNVGGLAGLTWWILGTSLQGDVLLYGVGGIAIGSMAAELHHVRRPNGPRTASLAARTVTDYIPTRWQRHMIVVAGLSVAMVVAGATLSDARKAAWWGLVALGVVATAHLVQRRVAARPRPALATGLQQADDLARGLAIDRGLAQPATYFALVLLAHGAIHLESNLGGAAVAMTIGAWLYALYAWWHNRRLGLDFVMYQPLATGSHA